MKRWLPHIGIVVGISIAIYALFFATSEVDRIRARLEQLEEAVAVSEGDTNLVLRAARVKKELSEVFIKDVVFRIPELTGSESGRGELVGLAANAPRLYRTADVDLGDLDIDIDDTETSAVAHGEASLNAARHSGELERDTRTVSLRFDKIDDEWRVVEVSVSARRDAR